MPTDGTQTDTGAAAGVEDNQNTADNVMDGFRYEQKKVPEQPEAPLDPEPAPAPLIQMPPVFAAEVREAPPADLKEIAEYVVQKEKEASTDAERDVYRAAARHVLQEVKKREAAMPQVQPRPGLVLQETWDAYDQLKRAHSRTKTLVPADSADTTEGTASVSEVAAREMARSAFVDGKRKKGPPAQPMGMHSFSSAPKSVQTQSDYHPGAAKGLKIRKDIPFPGKASKGDKGQPAVGRAPETPQAEGKKGDDFSGLLVKGVRIQYDPDILAAAEVGDATLSDLVDRLAGAKSPRELEAAMAGARDSLGQALSHYLDESVLAAPTAISLRTIVESASRHREDWENLPEDLRHPGGLRRIHGFVLDASGEDLILLGSREGNGDPLDLDDLIVGLRASWRDGEAPLCSLEPDSQELGGPQRVLVKGVPKKSHFALVMLDADYEMKRVLFGKRPVDVKGFVSLHRAATRALEGGHPGTLGHLNFTARFWFTPVPPGIGEIRVAPGRGAVLFNARFQVLTESLTRSGSGFTGTGGANPLLERTTAQFSQQIEAFKAEVREFAELQALFDVVLLGTVLRRGKVSVPILSRLVDLPVRDAQVPETYDGVTAFIRTAGIKFAGLCGGVTMRMGLTPGSMIQIEDPRVRRFVGRLRPGTPVQHVSGTPLPVPKARLAKGVSQETDRLRVQRLAGQGESARGLRLGHRVVSASPRDPEAYRLRARTYAAAGLYWLADRDLQTSQILDPDNPTYRILRLQARSGRGDRDILKEMSPDDRARVADAYLSDASDSLAAGAPEQAIAPLSRALELEPGRLELWVARSGAYRGAGSIGAALNDMNRALAMDPDRVGLLILRSRLWLAKGDREKALADANAAVHAKPDQAGAYLARATILLEQDPLETEKAEEDIRRAVERAPENPAALLVLARFLMQAGDRDGSFVACRRIIKAAPGYAGAYAVRARLRAVPALAGGRVSDRHQATLMLEDLNTSLAINPRQEELLLLRARLFLAVVQDMNRQNMEWLNDQQFMMNTMASLLKNSRALNLLTRLTAMGVPSSLAEAKPVIALFQHALLEGALGDVQRIPSVTRDEEVRQVAATLAAQVRSVLMGAGKGAP